MGDVIELLTIDEAAAYLRLPVSTLRYWRSNGQGPCSRKVGRRVMYVRADLHAWLKEQASQGAVGPLVVVS